MNSLLPKIFPVHSCTYRVIISVKHCGSVPSNTGWIEQTPRNLLNTQDTSKTDKTIFFSICCPICPSYYQLLLFYLYVDHDKRHVFHKITHLDITRTLVPIFPVAEEHVSCCTGAVGCPRTLMPNCGGYSCRSDKLLAGGLCRVLFWQHQSCLCVCHLVRLLQC